MSALQRWIRHHPVPSDGLLALALFAIGIAGVVTSDVERGTNSADPLAYLLIAAMTAPLALRRVRPWMVLFVVATANLAFLVADYPFPVTLPLLISIYTVAVHSPRADAVLANGAVLIVTVVIFTIGVFVDADFGLAEYLASIGILASAWLFGDSIRTRREYIDTVEERAHRAETEREMETKRAVAAERTRIARELHDVVAHNMSVLVVQAGAAQRVIQSSPEQAKDALAAIETTGREALDEMRLLLGVLRDDSCDPDDRAPQPGVNQLEDLITHCADAGLPVELTVHGNPQSLPVGMELSAYRIIQEALTNAIKHAGPARASISVSYAASTLDIVVKDNGRGAGATASEGGQGHIGMHERVELYGGSLFHGPRVGGGYEVKASFPLSLAAAS